MLKSLMLRRLALGIIALLMLLIVALVFVFAQEEQLDSTQMKLIQERVKVAIKTSDQYKLLKELGIECPPFDSTEGRAWELTMNQWQRIQLEKKGVGVSVLSGIKPDVIPNRVEYELMKEIDLEKENLGGLVVGAKNTSSTAVSFLVQRDYREIIFYSSEFTSLSSYRQTDRYTDVFPSKNLEYVGILTPVKIPTKDERVGCTRFTLISSKGVKLWEKEQDAYYDVGKKGYSVSIDGKVVERDHASGILTFYDQMGKDIKKIKVGIGGGDPETEIRGGVFSDDGELVLIAVEEGEYPGPLEEGARVSLFTSDGEESWVFNTEENAVRSLNISKLGNYAIVSSRVWPSPYPPDQSSTYLLSKTGKLIEKYENVLASSICFSSNEKYALFDSHIGTFLIDLPSGEVVLKYGRKGAIHQMNCFDISEDARLFGLATPSAVVLVSFDGSRVWSEFFPSVDRNSSLRLSDDGKQLLVQVGPKIRFYQRTE
jgi:hypothetical protein